MTDWEHERRLDEILGTPRWQRAIRRVWAAVFPPLAYLIACLSIVAGVALWLMAALG